MAKPKKDYKKIIKQAVEVDSRAATDIDYNAKTKVMTVKFKSGRIYEYSNIPASLYEQIIHAPSIGSFLNQHVVQSGNYPYVELL